MDQDAPHRTTMRITCPNCSTLYDVPRSSLAARRSVRCSRCGAVWQPTPATATSSTREVGPERLTPKSVTREGENPRDVADRSQPSQSGPRRRARETSTPYSAVDYKLRAAWIASFLIIAGALAATVYWRGEVMKAWPPSSRILSLFDA
jgi:predicted Zn finger-like uncharacterized protein